MRQGGFTLLELLISVTMLALIASLLGAGLQVAASNWGRAHARIEAAQEVRLIEQFIIRKLSEARLLRVRHEDGKSSIFEGEPSRIAFTALLPTHQGVAGLYRLGLFSEPQARSERLVLSYGLYRFSVATPAQAQVTPRRVLLRRLQQIRFDFFGPLADGGGNGWQEEWPHAQRLPELVRLRFWSETAGARAIIVPMHLGTSSPVGLDDRSDPEHLAP